MDDFIIRKTKTCSSIVFEVGKGAIKINRGVAYVRLSFNEVVVLERCKVVLQFSFQMYKTSTICSLC